MLEELGGFLGRNGRIERRCLRVVDRWDGMGRLEGGC